MNLKTQDGFTMIGTLFFLAISIALTGAYFAISQGETIATRSAHKSASGFYAAEAGLNIRAEEVRQTFVGYNRPEGTSPETVGACLIEGNTGSEDYICKDFDIGNHEVSTYIVENPTNPIITTIPPGERFQNLNAQEYRYSVSSIASDPFGSVQAQLELRFISRLVPLFQFVAFYNKDLEILPGAAMTLSGPIHTNGDLYLNTDASLNVHGQVTSAGALYRGRKNTNVCNSNQVRILNPATLTALLPSCSTRTLISNAQVAPYNGMIQFGVQDLTVPEPEALNPEEGNIYWDRADLRIVLELNASNVPVGIQVRNGDQSVDAAKTTALNACAGNISGRAVGTTNTFYSNREAKTIRMLEVDMRSLLNCIHNNSLFGAGIGLDDDSDGGIVFHFTLKGPQSALSANNYGVRIRNAAQLQASIAAPVVEGITVVTDQAIYTHGNYNSTGKIPAALMSDSLNILSNNWNLSDASSASNCSSSVRVASNTTINAAVLSGTDSTGATEGTGGQGGAYNGGLENYPRLHEYWTGRTLTYRGSFVSLNTPEHVAGLWVYGCPQYTAPTRNWDYDTAFNDAANLPPLTPRFVYLKQELFVRDYELNS